jgi:hypothetical protein
MIIHVQAKSILKNKVRFLVLMVFFFTHHVAKAQNQNEQIDTYARSFSADKFDNIDVGHKVTTLKPPRSYDPSSLKY